MEELSPLLPCHAVTWVRERCPSDPSLLASCNIKNWSSPLPASAGLKVGPAPPLGSTEELTLLRDMGEPTGEHEHRRSGPALHLPYGGLGRGEIPPPAPR